MQPEVGSNMTPSEFSVLVVEDGESEVFLLKRAFQEAKLRNPLLVFGDGQEVIDHLSRLWTSGGKRVFDPPPALMLLDLKMPRKSGLEVLE
jgi:CheY-like chemotaxis protein